MNIKLETQSTQTVLKIEGRLDTITAPELENAVKNIETNDLVLDIENLEYISSAGLRVVLGAHKKFAKTGSFKVVNTKPEIMEIFEMTGFADILDVQ